MEFQKNFGNFSFGGGTMKTAGSGTLDQAVDAPEVRTKYDKKVIARNAAKAAVLTLGVLAKHKIARRNKKK